MFVVYVGSILTTLLWIAGAARARRGAGRVHPRGRALAVVHRAVRQLRRGAGRRPQQGPGRLAARPEAASTWAKKLEQPPSPRRGDQWFPSRPSDLRKGDVVLVEAGDMIPADGEVIEGVASVDESAITGESRAGDPRSRAATSPPVTGGTRVLSDWLVVRVTVNPGETFIDRMIAMVEGAKRQKTPNEIALTILLVALTIVFLVVDRDAAAVLAVQRGRRAQGRASPVTHHGAGRAAGLPDPDHHRRPAVGHRRGRHEPHDAGQRDRHLGPRGRSRRRRRRAAARQDRHHHARQPPGLGLRRRAGRRRSASWPTPRSWPRWPTRRRKAAASWCWPSRSSTCASATLACAERRRSCRSPRRRA